MRARPAAAALGVVSAALLGDQLRRSRARHARRRTAEEVRSEAVREALAVAPRPNEPFVAVVMAAYNEAPSIEGVLKTLPGRVGGLPVHVVVVDDGSADDTALKAGQQGAIVAQHQRNLGQGDGLRTGFATALSLGAEVVVTMDADGQHDPHEMADLVQPVLDGVADYVQGSRFLGVYDDAGSYRDAGIRGFTQVINTLAGTTITDCTNGYRAIRASELARMRLVEDRFSASEIIIEAGARGLRMLEVPVHIRRRDAGESKKPRGLGYPLGYAGAIVRSWGRTLRR